MFEKRNAMFWNKVKQFLFKNNESTSTRGSTGGEETVEEMEPASRVTNSEAVANIGKNSASLEATEDKNEATGLNEAGDDITEDTTPETNFDAKTEKPPEENIAWDNAVRRHREFLVDRIFTEFGLLDKLYESDSISDKEMEKINEPRAFYKRNKKLLEIIIKRNNQHELIEALKTSGQSHLVNYLKTDGKYHEGYCGDWPLNDYEIKILQKNRGNLADLLDACDLLSRLYSTRVINRRQRDFINSKPTPYEKNEALLDILKKCSLNAYRQTIRCLHLSNQSHITEILEKGGVLVRVDVSVEGKANAANRLEEEIAAGIANQLSEKELSEASCNRIWELVKLNLVAARQGHSVALYFVSLELGVVDRLQQMTKDGRLKETIETVFSRLIRTSVKIRVKLKRITPDFKQCIQYFKDIMKQPKSDKTITDIQVPTMNNLQFEILDSILLKSYLEFVVRENQVLKNKDYHAFRQLALVNICWFQRIRKMKFKKRVWQSLVGFYRKQEKALLNFGINRQYLEENIRLQGLVNRLKSNDCLTDVQTTSLYRQNVALGKKISFNRFRDLTLDVVKKIEKIHFVFIKSLCDTKQQFIAKVIKSGGAVTKAEIKFQKAKTSVQIPHRNLLRTVERINEIRDKTKARSHDTEEFVDKLKHDDLEILSASQDGDIIIVWIWSKTAKALEKLHTLTKSNLIMEYFTELVKNLSSSPEEQNPAMIKPKVNIAFEQFEKNICFLFDLFANFTSKLDLKRRKEYEQVMGVTKLRNKIYVLLNRNFSPCEILVFEDEIPFRLQKRIKIKEIENPHDITSIEMENSLYVLDLGNRCVWKIKEKDEEEKKEKIITWLEFGDYSVDWAQTLSVTRDGQLLLIGRRKKDDPFCSLWIFGGSEKADLRRSILLPEDIQWSSHAVETSKGNFIISHEIKRKRDGESGSDGGVLQKEEEVVVVSEVSGDGRTILRRFIPENEEQKLSAFVHLSIDSFDRVFLTDYYNNRVILFDSDLQWNGILIPTEEEDGEEGREIRWPYRLFYDEEKKELIVGGLKEVFVYTLNRK